VERLVKVITAVQQHFMLLILITAQAAAVALVLSAYQ
jgi:hypothetical protein